MITDRGLLAACRFPGNFGAIALTKDLTHCGLLTLVWTFSLTGGLELRGVCGCTGLLGALIIYSASFTLNSVMRLALFVFSAV